MEKIKEIDGFNEIKQKINELVKAVNGFYEDLEILEGPIYEKLASGECLIISKSRGGLLVARNEGGRVSLKRVSLNVEKGEE
ncbi:MAG: hypothetical protein H8D26_09545 [Methanomicrobia archaeon]|nr:hypothetical protein [Methanomicrobia archaeon]